MRELHQVHRTLASFENRLQRILSSAPRKVAKKRIPSPQRQKSERNPPLRRTCREHTVHDFVRSPVAAHRDELPIALIECFLCELRRVSRRSRSNHIDVQPSFTQPCQRRPCKLRGPTATRSRIYDCKEAFHRDALNL